MDFKVRPTTETKPHRVIEIVPDKDNPRGSFIIKHPYYGSRVLQLLEVQAIGFEVKQAALDGDFDGLRACFEEDKELPGVFRPNGVTVFAIVEPVPGFPQGVAIPITQFAEVTPFVPAEVRSI